MNIIKPLVLHMPSAYVDIAKFNYMIIQKDAEYADYLYLTKFDEFDFNDKMIIMAHMNTNLLENEIDNSLWEVRNLVAQLGSDELRDILITDKSCHVRSSVAKYGNEQHRTLLANDTSKKVRASVYKNAQTDDVRNLVFSGNKLAPSMIRSVLSSDTTNKTHIAKCKLLKK